MMGLGVPGRFVTSTMETWRCQKPLLVRAVLFRICVLFSWRYRLSHWGFWEIDNLMSLFVSIFFSDLCFFFWLLGNSRVPNIMRKKNRGYLSTNAIDIDSAKIRLNASHAIVITRMD